MAISRSTFYDAPVAQLEEAGIITQIRSPQVKGIESKPLRRDGSRGCSIGRLRNTNRFTRI